MAVHPTATLQEEKSLLRAEMRRRLTIFPAVQREAANTLIRSRLSRLNVWSGASAFLFYAPLASEPDIWPLARVALSEGKRLLLPRHQASSDSYEVCEIRDLKMDVVSGRFGAREAGRHCTPIRLNPLDLALVPGLAFDLNGGRLGRGKGYYDRLLPAVGGIRCGIAFDEQIVPRVPAEPHDIFLNCILTPTRWIEL